jgi:hypothetical protein
MCTILITITDARSRGFVKEMRHLVVTHFDAAAIALHYMHYNFCRVHKTLRVTPAMEAGITDHVWSIEEIAMLLEAQEKNQTRKRLTA